VNTRDKVSSQPDVQLKCRILRESDKAYLVVLDGDEASDTHTQQSHWIPKSQVTDDDLPAVKGVCTLFVTRWFAGQKNW
jgi:hypothetical protein